MLADAASFQCVLPPWWLLFKKVVPCQPGPTFVPNWEFELFALNCRRNLTCVPPLLGPPVSRPPRVGSLGVVANVLLHTVADRMEMLEHVPDM